MIKPDRRRYLLRAMCSLCLLGTILFIFSNSSDAGDVSGGKSETVMLYINTALNAMGARYTFTEAFIRKAAHFTEYALLGFWLITTLRAYTRRICPFVAWPLWGGLLIAVCDECYQLSVPERSGQVTDIMIDYGGVLAGMLAGLALLFVFLRCRARRTRKKEA